jgi:hypothetical protein
MIGYSSYPANIVMSPHAQANPELLPRILLHTSSCQNLSLGAENVAGTDRRTTGRRRIRDILRPRCPGPLPGWRGGGEASTRRGRSRVQIQHLTAGKRRSGPNSGSGAVTRLGQQGAASDILRLAPVSLAVSCRQGGQRPRSLGKVTRHAAAASGPGHCQGGVVGARLPGHRQTVGRNGGLRQEGCGAVVGLVPGRRHVLAGAPAASTAQPSRYRATST